MAEPAPHDAPAAHSAWHDASLAGACLAIDPSGLGGLRVRAQAGPVRDAWTAQWRTWLQPSIPVRGIPLHVDDGRLFGGLDLAASLTAGRPIEQPGLLAQVDGGYALLSMAERIDPATAARIATAVESGETGRGPGTRFAIVAFDEGDDEEGLADPLVERLALCVDLRGCSVRDLATPGFDRASVDLARATLAEVEVGDDVVEALCGTAVALGIGSMRMPLFALRVARAVAALRGRHHVDADDAADAARLVYASRARRLAAPETDDGDAGDGNEEAPSGADEPPPDDRPEDAAADATDATDATDAADATDASAATDRPLDEVVLEATVAAIPADLLKQLAADAARQRAPSSRGSGAGALGRSRRRGAPAGVRRGRPRASERLGLVETLRAAAPWQRIRRTEALAAGKTVASVQVRAEDLHVVRFKQRHPTTTIFVVDASGSSALHRLAEAKGAVELLLADCYVRRDQVAVLAFRGKGTELLLPPTRSLVRARRSLAGLPGGGGTPLASALDATRDLVVALRRRGDTALAVLLTDGRGNVARDGSGGRPRAEADALVSARSLKALAVDVLLIDTSPQPHPQAARLADAMGATYRPLPYAGAGEMSRIVNDAVRSRSTAQRMNGDGFAGASRFVDAGGVRWNVAVLGQGPVLLLLHGTGASNRSFRDLAPLLATHFTVVAPDLPGHAKSSTPAASGMSVNGMASSLAALLTALALEPVAGVGHSAGAAVLVRMALDRQVDLQALVGLNAALLPLDGVMRVMSPMAKMLALAPGVPRLVSGFARDDRAVQRLVDSTGSTLDDEGRRLYAELVRDRRHVAGAIAMMAAWDLDRTFMQLPRLTPAPLLIVGANDRTVPPAQARRVADVLPGTRIVTLPKLGHLAHEEAPHEVAALIVGQARERRVLAERASAR